MKAGNLPLAGDRWTAFVETWTFVGKNFTGAVFAMQVRLTPDTSGTPLVNLATVTSAAVEGVRLIYGGSATVDAHIAAGRLAAVPAGMLGTDTIELSQLGMRINETTMEGLPAATEIGLDAVLAWDLHITPVGNLKQKWLGGTFTVRAGVTQ